MIADLVQAFKPFNPPDQVRGPFKPFGILGGLVVSPAIVAGSMSGLP